MEEKGKWLLSEGYCTICNGEINYCKVKDKKEKVTKFDLSTICSMQKELKYDWVLIKFDAGGKIIKKEFTFKKIGDGENFMNAVLANSVKGRFFDARTENIGVYDAVRRPLSIFMYTAGFIAAVMAISYGIVYGMQIMDIKETRVPILLYIPMQIVYALGITKCLIIIGVIGLLCFIGAMMRVVKRPVARIIKTR